MTRAVEIRAVHASSVDRVSIHMWGVNLSLSLQFRPAYKKDRTLTLVQNFLRELGSLYKTFLGKNFLSNSYQVIFFDFDPPEKASADFDPPEKANFAAPEDGKWRRNGCRASARRVLAPSWIRSSVKITT